MYKVCKTEKSKQRQKFIEECFLKILKKKHYEDITVSEICISASIPRKAFYRYFETKEDVLDALIEHTLTGYTEYYEIKKQERRTLKYELKCYFDFWLDEPMKGLLTALKKSNLIEKLYSHSKQIALGGFVNTNKFLPEETSFNQKQIFNFAVIGLLSVMMDWFNNGCKQSTEEMALIASRLLNSPIFSNLDKLGIENDVK